MDMTNKPYDLRPATPQDLALLKRLYRASRDKELELMPWPTPLKETFLSQQFDLRQADYVRNYANAEDQIIEIDGDPVGRFLVDRSRAVWCLVDIVLLSKAREQGMGRALVQSLIDEARYAGRELWLEVETHNRAQNLYKRLGFKVTDESPTHLHMALNRAHAQE